MRDAQPQAIFVPDDVARAMGWPDPPAAPVEFQRRELISKHESSDMNLPGGSLRATERKGTSPRIRAQSDSISGWKKTYWEQNLTGGAM